MFFIPRHFFSDQIMAAPVQQHSHLTGFVIVFLSTELSYAASIFGRTERDKIRARPYKYCSRAKLAKGVSSEQQVWVRNELSFHTTKAIKWSEAVDLQKRNTKSYLIPVH